MPPPPVRPSSFARSYIAEGTALVQVEGEDPKTIATGSAVYEPANIVMLHFDNPSDTGPLRFIDFYLLNGKQELLEMLPPHDSRLPG